MILRIGLIGVVLTSLMYAQRGGAAAPGAGAGGAATAPPAAAAAAGQAAGGGRAQGSAILIKAPEEQKWYADLGGIAEVNEIRYTSAPRHRPPNPTAPGARNPMIIHAMTFVPKNLDRSKKQPLIVFAHQGIHSDFGHDYEYGVVRDLVEQGYSVIGPDYRGSTGYGGGFYNEIDYGGLEVEDVFQARAWMLENYDFLDEKRVGMMGWSHGGMITLMNILLHPGAYAAAYAGVPVTDLVLRLG